MITQAGEVVGTLNYMSPEQLSGEMVDHRTDIYSVGVLAYELITGHMAFPGTIQTGVLFKILNAAPLPIEALVTRNRSGYSSRSSTAPSPVNLRLAIPTWKRYARISPWCGRGFLKRPTILIGCD